MADWTGGYSAEWRVSYVDPDTWDETGPVEGVRSVSIERGYGESAPLLESATMEVDGEWGVQERWVRISMVANQGGRERVDVATMLFAAASTRMQQRSPTSTVTGWSVLKPASDAILPIGSYAPIGVDIAERAAELLRSCVAAPVEVDGKGPKLNDHMVFDPGMTVLEAVWAILGAGRWCVQIDGMGVVHILPMPTEPALDLDKAHAALLMPGVDDDLDLSDVPNRYTVIDGANVAVASNTDEDSPVSITVRHRIVDAYDDSPVLVGGESLESYAARKLAEASTVMRSRRYTREWWPGVLPYSVVRGGIAEVGLDGDMRVVAQSLVCGRGVTVTETATQEVRLWQ